MNFIINPLNGEKYSIYTEQGKSLLKSYVQYYKKNNQVGGALTSTEKELAEVKQELKNVTQNLKEVTQTNQKLIEEDSKKISHEECEDKTNDMCLDRIKKIIGHIVPYRPRPHPTKFYHWNDREHEYRPFRLNWEQNGKNVLFEEDERRRAKARAATADTNSNEQEPEEDA